MTDRFEVAYAVGGNTDAILPLAGDATGPVQADDGQLILPRRSHAELPGGGHHDYFM
jgi:hypothetical protein